MLCDITEILVAFILGGYSQKLVMTSTQTKIYLL